LNGVRKAMKTLIQERLLPEPKTCEWELRWRFRVSNNMVRQNGFHRSTGNTFLICFSYSVGTSNSENQHYYPKAVLCNFDSPGKANADIKKEETQRTTTEGKRWLVGEPHIPQRSCCYEAKLKSNWTQRMGKKGKFPLPATPRCRAQNIST
jgi:hypothetical protein